MCPLNPKWTLGSQAMFAADGEVHESDVKGLISKASSSDFSTVHEIYVDLSAATYISPMAVSQLYVRYSALRRIGKKFVFLNPNSGSSEMLKLFGADYVFPVVSGM
ncbi:MAG: STAS domain-containing protein [Candidatus Brocadiia bacterium]